MKLESTDLTAPRSVRAIAPFLKWAGGKRWFAERYIDLLPTRFNRYFEPFLGSGAIFFALRPARALLSDLNGDLINCYCAVRSDPNRVRQRLEHHHKMHNKQYYYQVRKQIYSDAVESAARFIYLNRTCWNGLYRVNKLNAFNVPIGTKTNVILPTDNFNDVSQSLRSAEIYEQDFEETIDAAGEGDFIFVDPPYTVKHNMNGFIKYNDKIFSWTDQLRLRDAVARATSRGALVLVTNANHHSIREIYDGVGHQEVISRHSILSGRPQHRGLTEELTIRTW